MEFESVIGLEVHVQLNTKSKIFSGSSTQYGSAANTQASAIDLGLPGVLPVLNEQAVIKAIKFGLAINADIAKQSIFARKNYFYPDLPKGYQISQYEKPVVAGGFLSFEHEGDSKKVRITRAHLEEDAGKSIHNQFLLETGIDLNRAGTPLLEVVSEPEIRSASEAVAYLKTLHALVMALDICDGNLQEGSFRCDANVSIRPMGQLELGTRTEIKNVNSFKFVEKAINYEIERQIIQFESGQPIIQETRLYDPEKNQTRSMRTKEEAHDYRYFPDPDLLPVEISAELIESIAQSMPEFPQAKVERFIKDYHLTPEDAKTLVQETGFADFFEATLIHSKADTKVVANWLLGEISGTLNKLGLDLSQVTLQPSQLGALLNRIEDKTISSNIGKSVLKLLFEDNTLEVDKLIEQEGLKQVNNADEIEAIIQSIIQENPAQVSQYQNGKIKVFGFFVGKVMKATQGKANPAVVNELLKKHL